jgi:simple sugar transport system permease protein
VSGLVAIFVSGNVWVALFTIGISLAAPIIWAALGELIVEQSGVLNIGIEGVMLFAAFACALAYTETGSIAAALATAVGTGIVCGLVLGVFFVRLGGDQIVIGILFSLVAIALTTLLSQKYLNFVTPRTLPTVDIPGLGAIPYVGHVLFQQDALVYGSFVVAPIVWFVMFRTWFGLHARTVADHPRAGEAAGLDVRGLRYVALVFGCALTSVGGATLVLSTSGGFQVNMTNGRGYIALAVVVLARWNPFGVILAALLFGTAQALQFVAQNLGPLGFIHSDVWLMLPYAVTILAVVFAAGSHYPAACGVPFRPASR